MEIKLGNRYPHEGIFRTVPGKSRRRDQEMT